MAASPNEEERQLSSSCLGRGRTGISVAAEEENVSAFSTSSPIGGGSRLLPLASESIASSKAASCKPLPATPQGTHVIPPSETAAVTPQQPAVHTHQQARLSSSFSHQTRLDSLNSPSKPGSRQVSEDPFSDILKRVAPPSLVLLQQQSSFTETEQSSPPPAEQCPIPSDQRVAYPHSSVKTGSTIHPSSAFTNLHHQTGSSLKTLPGPRLSLTAEEEGSPYQTACSSPCSPTKPSQSVETHHKFDEKNELGSSPVFFSDADLELLAAPSSSVSLPSASPQHSHCSRGVVASAHVGRGVGGGEQGDDKTGHDLASSPLGNSNDGSNPSNVLDELEFFISSVTNACPPSTTQTTPAANHRPSPDASPPSPHSSCHNQSFLSAGSGSRALDISPFDQPPVAGDTRNGGRAQEAESGGSFRPSGACAKDLLSGTSSQVPGGERAREGAKREGEASGRSWDMFDCQLRGWDDLQKEAKREAAQVDERQLEDAGKKTIWVVHQVSRRNKILSFPQSGEAISVPAIWVATYVYYVFLALSIYPSV